MARLRSKTGTFDQGIIASSSAPSAAFTGQIWYNNATGVTYQYTTDGASKFWLDISSSGIGTSIGRGVDFVGDIDPHKATNGTGLAVGSVYYNREKNRHFVCTDASNNANVWAGRYQAGGGIVTDYESGGTFYKVHTFTESGVLMVEEAITVDYLVVAGGGAGGDSGTNSGGGGGAGGMRYGTNFAVAAGKYAITVGAGGTVVRPSEGGNGGNSIFSTITSTGGGGGGAQDDTAAGQNGGSGGGRAYPGGNPAVAGGTGINDGGTFGTATFQGYNGGAVSADGAGNAAAGGGGGAGGVGQSVSQAGSADGGTGGVGRVNDFRTGSNIYYAGGGAGEAYDDPERAGGNGGGGNTGKPGTNGLGGGGGGGSNGHTNRYAGDGGSGIVVIRYSLAL